MRNEILHLKFEFDENIIDGKIGKLLNVIYDFNKKNKEIEYLKYLNEEERESHDYIIEGYLTHISMAKRKAEICAGELFDCNECGFEEVVVIIESGKKYECQYCGDDTNNYSYHCDACHEFVEDSYALFMNEGYCDGCYYRLFESKDGLYSDK